MRFISTRNQDANVNFEKAVRNCMPVDGGLFVPYESPDLRRWILYTNETTSFQNIAGTLTSACINDEFSPIICEAIATKAFPFSPELKKLDENLYLLDLSTGPTGNHKDFGISYIASTLESMLTLNGGKSIFLDVSVGPLGASLAKALRGKKNLKAVLVYPKGKARGLEEEDLAENGGNIVPLEIDGSEEECHKIVRQIFDNRTFIEKNNVTVANSANIGVLMPQMFFYTFAFSRLKQNARGNIYYAMPSGNYSNVVSSLYSWRLALPMGGIIVPSSTDVVLDPRGDIEIVDSIVPIKNREKCDPVSPSNLERLEDFFHNNTFMLQNLVFLADVNDNEETKACQELFSKYKIFADKETSRAYAAAKKRIDLTGDENITVLVKRNDATLSKEYLKLKLGELPEISEKIQSSMKPFPVEKTIKSADEIMQIIESLK